MSDVKTTSDYWLDGLTEGYDFSKSKNVNLGVTIIRLANAKKAISNFVNILTNKTIPVQFISGGNSSTDGKTVKISTAITKKEDFDPAVGLALHEGAHIVLSDFSIRKLVWMHVPGEIFDVAKKKKIKKQTVLDLIGDMHNYIEDRYIDNYIFTTAPGYRGYYVALYNTYWNNEVIGEMLASTMYRAESLDSYKYRILGLTNIRTDLMALRGLYKIAKVIDLKHINRLIDPQDRLNVAYDIVKIILDSIADVVEDDTKSNTDSISDNGEEVENPDPLFEEPECPINTTNIGVVSDISTPKQLEITKELTKQTNFLNGDVAKNIIDSSTNMLLDTIEKSGVSICKVGKELLTTYTQERCPGIDCIVIKNLTRELIETDHFPLKHQLLKCMGKLSSSAQITTDAVNEGIRMGTILGRKLQIRNDSNVTTFTRKRSGKIDNRLLSDLGWESESVFYNKQVDAYNNVFLHISVDASASMLEPIEKWTNTLSAVVAICKAGSMLKNLQVTVSFRTTVSNDSDQIESIPYIVIAYDSSKDKFNKVVNLFPLLMPGGCTPEGLTYEAILDTFNQKNVGEERYFINFSDGEPFMKCVVANEVIEYYGERAATHTRNQINMIKNAGYGVLSYFIESECNCNMPHIQKDVEEMMNIFKKMYGNDAKFINITNILDIIKTLNHLFTKK